MFDLIKYVTTKRDKGIIIWLCNIGAEKYWNKVNSGMVDKQEDIIVSHIEEMNLLICRKQDIIILREKPDAEYLRTLKEIGFDIPKIFVPENSDYNLTISELVIRDEHLQVVLKKISESDDEVYFAPYAVTHLEEQIAQLCSLKLIGAPSSINAKINDKIFNRQIAEELQFPVCSGRVCNKIEEIREEYHRLTENAPFFKKVIIKEPFGASGKGLYIIDDKAKLESNLRLINRFARNNIDAKWLVEGWYDKKLDINYQIYIGIDGVVNVFSIKEQLLNNTVYIGSLIPANISEDMQESFKLYGEKIGNYLYNIGFTGVAGIDCFITIQNEIIPIIEINGRFTLSTYISFLTRVFENKIIATRYFRVLPTSPLDYIKLTQLLKAKGILFDVNKKEGVVIYTAGTLPSREIQGCKGYFGRIFALIIAKDNELIEIYIKKLEDLIEKL